MRSSNLPPGCSINDIPGNRPEDAEYEALMTEFYESLTKEELDLVNDGRLTTLERENLIFKAIQFGRKISNMQDKPEDYGPVFSESITLVLGNGKTTRV